MKNRLIGLLLISPFFIGLILLYIYAYLLFIAFFWSIITLIVLISFGIGVEMLFGEENET